MEANKLLMKKKEAWSGPTWNIPILDMYGTVTYVHLGKKKKYCPVVDSEDVNSRHVVHSPFLIVRW